MASRAPRKASQAVLLQRGFSVLKKLDREPFGFALSRNGDVVFHLTPNAADAVATGDTAQWDALTGAGPES